MNKLLQCLAVVACAYPLHAAAELTNEPLLGAGLRWRPAYDGSAATHVEVVPVVRYLGTTWFVRSTQGVGEAGARFALAPGLHVGAQLAYEPGRKQSESGFLRTRGVTDVDAGASIGAHLEWDTKIGPAPFNLLARVRRNTDSDLGTQADLRLSLGVFKRGPLGIALFTQGTWANAKSTNAYYGISAAQALATGLPAYAPGSGLLYGSAGFHWGVELAPRWLLLGSTEVRHLASDARTSPLTERSTNWYVSAGVVYRF
jgi:outer membrane scaffolding protein for murein synthesis (MipA/OmpV family)